MSNKPKVAATGIAGIMGALAVWAFNSWQGSESVWLLEDPVGGMVVALIAFFAGPVLRKFEKWSR